MKTQLKVFKIWQQGHIILIGEPNRIIPLASFRNLYLTSPIANHQILFTMYILSSWKTLLEIKSIFYNNRNTNHLDIKIVQSYKVATNVLYHFISVNYV